MRRIDPDKRRHGKLSPTRDLPFLLPGLLALLREEVVLRSALLACPIRIKTPATSPSIHSTLGSVVFSVVARRKTDSVREILRDIARPLHQLQSTTLHGTSRSVGLFEQSNRKTEPDLPAAIHLKKPVFLSEERGVPHSATSLRLTAFVILLGRKPNCFGVNRRQNRVQSQSSGSCGRGSSWNLQNTKSSVPIFLEPSRCFTRIRSRTVTLHCDNAINSVRR